MMNHNDRLHDINRLREQLVDRLYDFEIEQYRLGKWNKSRLADLADLSRPTVSRLFRDREALPEMVHNARDETVVALAAAMHKYDKKSEFLPDITIIGRMLERMEMDALKEAVASE